MRLLQRADYAKSNRANANSPNDGLSFVTVGKKGDAMLRRQEKKSSLRLLKCRESKTVRHALGSKTCYQICTHQESKDEIHVAFTDYVSGLYADTKDTKTLLPVSKRKLKKVEEALYN